MDPNSLSNYTTFLTTHLHLSLNVDFDAKILSGFVDVTLERLVEPQDDEEVVLDVANVNVKSVSCDNVIIPVQLRCHIYIYPFLIYILLLLL
jgi:aminopeptidase N